MHRQPHRGSSLRTAQAAHEVEPIKDLGERIVTSEPGNFLFRRQRSMSSCKSTQLPSGNGWL
jgi:hypothetical protein